MTILPRFHDPHEARLMSSDEEDHGSDLDDSLLLAASNQLERKTELPAANRAQDLSPANGAKRR